MSIACSSGARQAPLIPAPAEPPRHGPALRPGAARRGRPAPSAASGFPRWDREMFSAAACRISTRWTRSPWLMAATCALPTGLDRPVTWRRRLVCWPSRACDLRVPGAASRRHHHRRPGHTANEVPKKPLTASPRHGPIRVGSLRYWFVAEWRPPRKHCSCSPASCSQRQHRARGTSSFASGSAGWTRRQVNLTSVVSRSGDPGTFTRCAHSNRRG